VHKLLNIILACAMVDFFTPLESTAAKNTLVVGANVYDQGVLSQAGQVAEIERLAQNGVKTIRTGFSDKSLYFITQAYRRGISTVGIVYPTNGSNAKTKKRWSDAPLSQADPAGFAAWLKPRLDQMDAAGVRLTALELGNEINTSGYNGDIPVPGTGRVLGLSDLHNPEDPEAPAIAAGFRNYLRVMAALKDLRDHSEVNNTTPILLAGIADRGLPSPKAWDGLLGVSLPDTIAFLRQNGLDKLADGYGVHANPTGNPHADVAARITELDRKKIFSECGHGAKPCWLTEWGINNAGQSCPIDDAKRKQATEAERGAFNRFVRQGRWTAVIWFNWAGLPGPKEDASAIYRCGDLTDAGKLALKPM
jgi:hypothetical protein